MMNTLITENLSTLALAVKNKSTSGRGSSKKIDLYGIKKLRELILELAVRGKLVPQSPEDEPASKLLERIAVDKARLVREKQIKKQKAVPSIADDEKPFVLPNGWEWSRLGSFVSIIRGITFPASEKHREASEGRIACLRTANIQEQIDWEDLLFVDKKFIKREDQHLKQGDIVMSMANSRELVGKVSFTHYIPTGSATFGGFLSAIRPYFISASYLMSVLRTGHVREELIGSASQTTNIANISLEKLNPLLVAVPPIEEQHRIVAKVDELMTLCDQIEQQTEASLSAHTTLVENLLATLTSSKDADELKQNWQRIASHFTTLFPSDARGEASIDQLKQTILQLAVMGKLVPQDPNDEPATKLLERIATEKAQLVKEGKIKKQKPLPPIGDDEKPFDLPDGWEWCRLGQFVSLKGGFAFKSGDFLQQGTHQIIRMGNIRPDHLRIDENPAFVTAEIAATAIEYKIETYDILLTMTGTKGKRDYLYSLAVAESDLCNQKLYLNQRLCSVKPIFVNSAFVNRAMKDDRFLDAIYATSTGSANQANVGMDAISKWVLPLPPLTEQNRIVTKVNQLTTLCDQIKTHLQHQQKTRLHLADAMVLKALS